MGLGAATPMNLGGTAGVRPRGPHLETWHRDNATKRCDSRQAKEAAALAGTSVAGYVRHDERQRCWATRNLKAVSAKRRHQAKPGSLGGGAWKGHAV